jgi:hypothetical protein
VGSFHRPFVPYKLSSRGGRCFRRLWGRPDCFSFLPVPGGAICGTNLSKNRATVPTCFIGTLPQPGLRTVICTLNDMGCNALYSNDYPAPGVHHLRRAGQRQREEFEALQGRSTSLFRRSHHRFASRGRRRLRPQRTSSHYAERSAPWAAAHHPHATSSHTHTTTFLPSFHCHLYWSRCACHRVYVCWTIWKTQPFLQGCVSVESL